jgi:hypothetical protein
MPPKESKNNKKMKSWGMAQAVECLPGKHEALSPKL